MRKPVQIALIAAIIVLGAGMAVLGSRYAKTSAQLTETKSAEETARSQYAEAFNAIAEIQDSLSAITVRDGSVRMGSSSLQAEQKLTAPSRAEALESIALLNASIQRTKDRIGALEDNLRKSGVKIRGLQKMVTNLKKSVTEKLEQVATLTEQVNSLQTQVTGLETTVQADQVAIEEKRKELATIFVAVGTKKELAEQGLIVSKGGVLGLGKTVQLTGSYSPAVFTAVDTDQETVVRAPAARVDKVRVLSPQPKSSYELRTTGDVVELHILDPREFRKVKHLVIMTA
jgi:predicted  nucleic acid-binding Zn-ribbon protein